VTLSVLLPKADEVREEHRRRVMGEGIDLPAEGGMPLNFYDRIWSVIERQPSMVALWQVAVGYLRGLS
jgi:hypothetical protein